MNSSTLLIVDGQVGNPLQMTFDDLAAVDGRFQILDVNRIDPGRKGDAVSLEGLLELVQIKSNAQYLGLHSSSDNFHASIPLQPVRDRGMFIYRLGGGPLEPDSGGPVRFYIRDFAACHSDQVDECANVKFVDHVELTEEKGFDNRPEDDQEHEALHRE